MNTRISKTQVSFRKGDTVAAKSLEYVTKESARAEGFVSLTYPYSMPDQAVMLAVAVIQLGTKPFRLVSQKSGSVEIYVPKVTNRGLA